MAGLEVAEIVQAGIGHMENWLKQHGFNAIEINIWQAGSGEIKANGHKENIIVQVKTVLKPNQQVITNGTDRFALKDLALRLERVPYLATLIIDEDKNLIGEINWERLD